MWQRAGMCAASSNKAKAEALQRFDCQKRNKTQAAEYVVHFDSYVRAIGIGSKKAPDRSEAISLKKDPL